MMATVEGPRQFSLQAVGIHRGEWKRMSGANARCRWLQKFHALAPTPPPPPHLRSSTVRSFACLPSVSAKAAAVSSLMLFPLHGTKTESQVTQPAVSPTWWHSSLNSSSELRYSINVHASSQSQHTLTRVVYYITKGKKPNPNQFKVSPLRPELGPEGAIVST